MDVPPKVNIEGHVPPGPYGSTPLQGRRTMFAVRTLETVKSVKYERENRCVLSITLNVDNVGAERMSSGRLFQATGPATQIARLPSCSLVLGTTKSP